MCQEHEIENDLIPQIATCFAGGMGFTGEVCGAVSGAIMAIGLMKGPAENMQHMQQNMALVQGLKRRFIEKMKTVSCRELTGYDFTKPGAIEECKKSNVFETVCFPAVETAYHLVMEQLGSKPE